MAYLCLIFSAISQTGNFITEWENNMGTPTLEVEIAINPDQNLSYNYDIDWGDGTTDLNVTTSIQHVYSNNNPRVIEISGNFPALFMKRSSTAENLADILEWGANMNWQSMAFAFSGCSNINLINSIDIPDLSNVEDMSYMFHNCTNMNRFMNNWNVSNVRWMRGTFSGARNFGSQLHNWDVSNVIDMTSMFEDASRFNRELSWNTSSLREMSYMFAGASSFNGDISTFNVSGVQVFDGLFQNAIAFDKDLSEWVLGDPISMHNMFSGALKFNQDLSAWNFGSVTDMSHMFENAVAFDQDLGGWDISSAENMSYMLSGSNLSDCNYESTLNGWVNSAGSDVVLGADGLVYFDQSGRNSLLNNNWTIKGDIENRRDDCGLISEECGVGQSTFFVLEWDLSLPHADGSPANRTIEIPTSNQVYNYDIDWENDGIFDVLNANGNVSHTYPGTRTVYEVAIRESATNGSFPTISFWNSNYRTKVSSIVQWGCIAWDNFNRSFEGCANLTYSATDAPDLSANANFAMSSMFNGATIFNGNLNNWDVSNVSFMSSMFEGAESFNGDISSWDVSNVQSIARMFLSAHSFNADISGWNITNSITSLNSTFSHANSFNRDISGWDVSNVTDFSHTFHNCWVFDQDLDDWVVSSATTMYAMFYGALVYNNNNSPLTWDLDVSGVTTMTHMFRNSSFNQNIEDWDVSSVTAMSHMFALNSSFNQPLDNWTVTNVTNFYRMFYNSTAFDQPLNSWIINTSGAQVDMAGMFQGATSFDQPLNNWDVDNVVNMNFMFTSSGFNQPLNSWVVSNVTTMQRMFGQSAFNQSLASWDLSSISGAVNGNGSLVEMLDNCQMNQANFEATLNGWDLNPNTPSGLTLGAIGRQYCEPPHTGHANLINNHGWAINGATDICLSRNSSNPTVKLTPFNVNHANGILRVRRNINASHDAEIIRLTLFNMNGQLIYQSNDGSGLDIPTSSYSKGVYMLNIETTNGVESQKVSIN